MGYLYYTELAPLSKQLGELTQKVSAARTVRRVRITSTLTLASLWLVPRLAAFQEKHPDVHVQASRPARCTRPLLGSGVLPVRLQRAIWSC